MDGVGRAIHSFRLVREGYGASVPVFLPMLFDISEKRKHCPTAKLPLGFGESFFAQQPLVVVDVSEGMEFVAGG